MKRLQDKVALVVGGGSEGPPALGEQLAIGNGRAAAIQLAREGALVMVADRTLQAANDTAEAIRAEGARAEAVECDVVDEDQCRAAVMSTVRAFGGLQALVNNVGIADLGSVDDTPTDTFDHVQTVNVRGHFFTIKHAMPELEKSGGAIVTVSSINALRVGAGVGYETSKAALLALTRNVAVTCAPKGVRANTVLPGVIDSTMLRSFASPEVVESFSATVPLGRVGTPWDVATAIAFLLSDDAGYITGTELVVDGGLSAPM